MAERGSRKIPVTDREFLWVQDDDKGEVILHVGPTMVSPTAADRVVIDDGDGGFHESRSGVPQKMVELSDAQYAVLYNPLETLRPEEAGPNGAFKPGRNEARPLKNGTRAMIPGPCSFYLRPGQRVEVRDAHELGSNQYLVVKVYGEVDAKAPYYEITAKSAAITMATAEDVTEPKASTSVEDQEEKDLTRGQLIVIRGLDTQFYIPPTGVDVVPDLSVDASGTRLTAATARKILATLEETPFAAAAGPSASSLAEESELEDLFDDSESGPEEAPAPRPTSNRDKRKAKAPPPPQQMVVQQSARMRHRVQEQRAVAPPPRAEPEPISPEAVDNLLGSSVHREALAREVRKARLVRDAVVLSEKTFCVILDADGKRQIKRGPARVFPGPYDQFLTQGSEDRIYNAYELLPQRALWLRFIAPITKARLEELLPRGVDVERDMEPGDEMILTGVNSFFFPFNEIEILHPLTGQPHVGNDHSEIFIHAIGIDQKSGIYVRDLTTGEARLVRGKRSYLVDPRKEVHITRTVPMEQWNHWIAAAEKHKKSGRAVTTPWALSITVPHNTAVLATSADGQRVIEGPCVELLEYEEALTTLSLSTGRPKTDERVVETCFLRTNGNRVSDVVTLETADFVRVDVQVSYHVTFETELRDRWFNHDNYVGLLCDHLRSLVRGRARQLALVELWPNIPEVIRDTVLGEKDAETGKRSGRLFEENGMRVTEVEVLTSQILDDEIASLLDKVQRESVAMVIGDRQETERLRSAKLRHEIGKEHTAIEREDSEQKAALQELVRQLKHKARVSSLEDDASAQKRAAEHEATRRALVLQAQLERDRQEKQAALTLHKARREAEVELERLAHAEEQTHEKALADIEMLLIEANAKATVAEHEAVQPALVEALAAVGDKELLAEVAQNMNLVSLFKGKDVGALLQDVVGGTKLQRTIEGMLAEEPDEAEAD